MDLAKEKAPTMMSSGAQILKLDIADGCRVYPHSNGIPAIVMPQPGGPIPRTKGQVADSIVAELVELGLFPRSIMAKPQCRS